METLSHTWPWYVSGPLIAIVMFILLLLGKQFGISSTLRTLCSIGGAGKKVEFFDFDWKKQIWGLVFITGAIFGGLTAHTYLQSDQQHQISSETITELKTFGIDVKNELVPSEIFSFEKLLTTKGLIFMVLGGILVGFGTRWAGGCTSGHAISGLSNLQLPSLIAVVGFFIGGLIMTHFIFPIIFS